MAPIVNTIEIDRSPEEVFSYVTDPGRFAEWQKDVVKAEMQTGRPTEIGARFVTTRRISGSERTGTQEVTESRAPARWAVKGVDGVIRPSAAITLEPLDQGARTRVTFELDFEGHGAGIPLIPLVRRLAGKGAPVSHQNLKNLLEDG